MYNAVTEKLEKRTESLAVNMANLTSTKPTSAKKSEAPKKEEPDKSQNIYQRRTDALNPLVNPADTLRTSMKENLVFEVNKGMPAPNTLKIPGGKSVNMSIKKPNL